MLEKSYVVIPGEETFELPPLLISTSQRKSLERVVNMAAKTAKDADLVPLLVSDSKVTPADLETRKIEMAIILAEFYLAVESQWQLGDGIVGWIRQCEYTFEHDDKLHPLLRPDIWPHAGRASFVGLLEDRAIGIKGIDIKVAVGLRLTFRTLPSLQFYDNRFLLHLSSNVATAAYKTWAGMQPAPVCALPPERFKFEVITL